MPGPYRIKLYVQKPDESEHRVTFVAQHGFRMEMVKNERACDHSVTEEVVAYVRAEVGPGGELHFTLDAGESEKLAA